MHGRLVVLTWMGSTFASYYSNRLFGRASAFSPFGATLVPVNSQNRRFLVSRGKRAQADPVNTSDLNSFTGVEKTLSPN
jgi:hypothetical protein